MASPTTSPSSSVTASPTARPKTGHISEESTFLGKLSYTAKCRCNSCLYCIACPPCFIMTQMTRKKMKSEPPLSQECCFCVFCMPCYAFIRSGCMKGFDGPCHVAERMQRTASFSGERQCFCCLCLPLFTLSELCRNKQRGEPTICAEVCCIASSAPCCLYCCLRLDYNCRWLTACRCCCCCDRIDDDEFDFEVVDVHDHGYVPNESIRRN